ncbi:hypothetical protein HI914_02734 [Erysiphe necator]|nr:hypothetical protein HI914_02734 [Erysiphe necator]
MSWASSLNSKMLSIQNSPELVFQAVKTLAEQSIGNGTTASQLQITYKQLIEKEKELLAVSNELELARKSVDNL